MSHDYHVYFTERNKRRVMKWSPDTGHSEPVVSPSDDAEHELSSPYGLTIDASGHLLIADKFGRRIVRVKDKKYEDVKIKIKPNNKHYAGALPESPTGLFTTQQGRTLCAFSDGDCICEIESDEYLRLIVGCSPSTYFVFSGCRETVPPEEVLSTPIYAPTSVVLRNDGIYFFIERGYQCVREFHPQRGLRSIFPLKNIGRWSEPKDIPDELPIAEYYPAHPTALTLDRDGELYLSDMDHDCVWHVDFKNSLLRKVMRSDQLEVGLGPTGMSFGKDGVLWILESSIERVSGWTPKPTGFWTRLPNMFSTLPNPVRCPAAGGAGLVCGR